MQTTGRTIAQALTIALGVIVVLCLGASPAAAEVLEPLQAPITDTLDTVATTADSSTGKVETAVVETEQTVVEPVIAQSALEPLAEPAVQDTVPAAAPVVETIAAPVVDTANSVVQTVPDPAGTAGETVTQGAIAPVPDVIANSDDEIVAAPDQAGSAIPALDGPLAQVEGSTADVSAPLDRLLSNSGELPDLGGVANQAESARVTREVPADPTGIAGALAESEQGLDLDSFIPLVPQVVPLTPVTDMGGTLIEPVRLLPEAAIAPIVPPLGGTQLAIEPIANLPAPAAPAIEPVAQLVTPSTAPVLEPVAPAVAEVVAPVQPAVERSAAVVAPAVDAAVPVLVTAIDPVMPTLTPVVETAGPVVAVAEPVTVPVVDVVTSVVDPVAPIVEVVSPAAEPALDVMVPVVGPLTPVLEPVAPITQPVLDVVQPIVTPIVTPVAPALPPMLAPVTPVSPGITPMTPVLEPVSPVVTPGLPIVDLVAPAPAAVEPVVPSLEIATQDAALPFPVVTSPASAPDASRASNGRALMVRDSADGVTQSPLAKEARERPTQRLTFQSVLDAVSTVASGVVDGSIGGAGSPLGSAPVALIAIAAFALLASRRALLELVLHLPHSICETVPVPPG